MIKKYIITYDLNKPGQDYESLLDGIRTYNHIKVMKSVWFVKTNRTVNEIYNHLRALIDSSDRLFISEITENHAGWLDERVITWLNS